LAPGVRGGEASAVDDRIKIDGSPAAQSQARRQHRLHRRVIERNVGPLQRRVPFVRDEHALAAQEIVGREPRAQLGIADRAFQMRREGFLACPA